MKMIKLYDDVNITINQNNPTKCMLDNKKLSS